MKPTEEEFKKWRAEKRIPVSGPIAPLIKGVPVADVRDIIGKPIVDDKGGVIGTITAIDIDNWHGYINGVVEFK